MNAYVSIALDVGIACLAVWAIASAPLPVGVTAAALAFWRLARTP